MFYWKIWNDIKRDILFKKKKRRMGNNSYIWHTRIHTYMCIYNQKFYWEFFFIYSIPRFYYGNCSCKHRCRSETAAVSNNDAASPSHGRSDRCETWSSDRDPLCCVICVAFYLENRHSSLLAAMSCCLSYYPRVSHVLSRTSDLAADDRCADNDRRVP